MRVTQKDIARQVGVSQTIVSDVLQNRPRGRVSGQTRQAILETARSLGYRPNASARSLRTRRSYQVMYLITAESVQNRQALGELALSGLAATLAEQDYQLALRMLPAEIDLGSEIVALIAEGRCDACIVRVPEAHRWDWVSLRGLEAPVLFVGHCPDPVQSSIAFDAAKSIELILEALKAKGHRVIGLLEAVSTADYYRLARQAWEANTVRLGLKGIVETVQDHVSVASVAERWLPEAGGGSNSGMPTAFVCQKSRVGFELSRCLLRSGGKIGMNHDIAVMGDPVFGEATMPWLFEEGTLYLNQDQEMAGRLIAEETLRLLSGEAAGKTIRVVPTLCIV